jgi:hypothetical protein
MTNPFGRISNLGDISQQQDEYNRQLVEGGAEGVRVLRQIANMQIRPGYGQRDGYSLNGAPPAALPPDVDTLMRVSPRNDASFGLFNAADIFHPTGQLRNVDEDPQTMIPPRVAQPETMAGPAIPDRDWLDKLGRFARGVLPDGLGLLPKSGAVDLEHKATMRGIGDGLVATASTILEQAVNMAQGKTLLGAPVLGVPVAPSATDNLLKRVQAERMEVAQGRINASDEFRRTTTQQAIQEGVSAQNATEANVWGSTGGHLIGALPLAGMMEGLVAGALPSAATGLGGARIMESMLLRHGLASSGANIALTPVGSPLLPDLQPGDELGAMAAKTFLQPNFVGAAALGLGLGVAGGWFAGKMQSAFGVGENVRAGTNPYGIADPPIGDAPLSGPVNSFQEPGRLGSGYVFGQRRAPSSVGDIFYGDTPDGARPIAGLLGPGAPPVDPYAHLFPEPGRYHGTLPDTFDPSGFSDGGVPLEPITVQTRGEGGAFGSRMNLFGPEGVAPVVPRARLRAAAATARVTIDPTDPVSAAFTGHDVPPPINVATEIPTPRPLIVPDEQPLTGPVSAAPAPLSFGGVDDPFHFGTAQTNAPTLIPHPDATLSLDDGTSSSVFAQPQSSVPATLDAASVVATPQELLVSHGMEPEAAALISDPVEAVVPPERARVAEGVSGHDIARTLGSALRDEKGTPQLAYGVGDVNQVLTMNENGVQTLVGGRGVIYLTTDAGTAGGTGSGGGVELDGGLYPLEQPNAPQSNVTMQARQSGIAVDQAKLKIAGMYRQMDTLDPASEAADNLRGQIAQAETLVRRQEVPKSALTPMYVVSRRHLDLDPPLDPDMWEAPPSERTPAENEAAEIITHMMVNRTQTVQPINEIILKRLDDGRYNVPGGMGKLYNDLSFRISGESPQGKGMMVNHILRSLGYDSMSFTNRADVSRGTSQVGTLGAKTVMLLDPRAGVPALAGDQTVFKDAASLLATQMTKAGEVMSNPVRPDIAKIQSVGDIDFVNKRIIGDMAEHTIVKHPQDPAQLIAQVNHETPGYFAQAVTGPTGFTEVYVGAKPLTSDAMAGYTRTGYYPSQGVRDMKDGGAARRIYRVYTDDKGMDRAVFLPIRPGDAIIGPGQIITKAFRQRYIASTSAQPVIESGGLGEWHDFKEFAQTFIADLNVHGRTQIQTLFDPDAAELMPSIMKTWFDSKGIDNVLHRGALTAVFDQQWAKMHADLNPEINSFYEGMRDSAMSAADASTDPPSLHDLAAARGMYAIPSPGGPEIVLRSNTSMGTHVFDSEPAARTFLENFEPVEMNVETEGRTPSSIGQAPSPQTTPMGRALDPEWQYTGREQQFHRDLSTTYPLTDSVNETYGAAPDDPAEALPPTIGGTSVPTGDISERFKAMSAVLHKSLGWLKPNHAFLSEIEQTLHDAGFSELRPYADVELLKRSQAIALERGNSTYKALEKLRTSMDLKPQRDGTLWNLLALPDNGQRMAYIQANNLDPHLMFDVASLDRTVDTAFGTPAERAKHWQNVVSYMQELGQGQMLNRQNGSPVLTELYDKALAAVHPDTKWFHEHALNVRMNGETVNAVDLIGSMTHSYNFHKFVATDAENVLRNWRQIGAKELPTQRGEAITPFAPFAREVEDWIGGLRTGQFAGSPDQLLSIIADVSHRTGYPITMGEAKKLLGQGMGNVTKSFMGFTPAPILRDFLEFQYTTPFVGPRVMARAIKDFVTPSAQGPAFDRLVRLGLRASENELASASGTINPGLGDAEFVSAFTPEQVANRQALAARVDRIQEALPNWMRAASSKGMINYMKSNGLSRALSAHAALTHFDETLDAFGLTGGTGADVINAGQANPLMWQQMMDRLTVTMRPTEQLIRDMLEGGNIEGAAAEYAQHVVTMSQGAYGPLHAGKAWRTVTGRTALMFQNYAVNKYNLMKQVSGIGQAQRVMDPIARAKFAGGMLMLAGGTDWLTHRLREETGIDMTNMPFAHQLHSDPLDIGATRSPTVSAAVNTAQWLGAATSMFGDRPASSLPSGRGLGTLAFQSVVPYRNIERMGEAASNIAQSNEPGTDFLNYILTNKTGPNLSENFQAAKHMEDQMNNTLQRALTRPNRGNGAQ